MKNQILFAILICGLGTSNAQILVNQTAGLYPGLETAHRIASQDFEAAYNNIDCAAADEFIVPNGANWTIDSIKVFGEYTVGSTNKNTSMRIVIYDDNGGTPGNIVFQEDFDGDQDLNADGDCVLKPTCPPILYAARYWLSAVSTKTFLVNGIGTQWFWTRDSVGAGFVFQWKNPANGFSTGCTTFTTVSTCVSTVTDPGVAFIIYGCTGGPQITPFPSDTAVCADDSLVLNPGNGGISNATFAWNTGATTQQLGITQSGFYNVSVTNPNTNCHATACINVTINENPHAESLENDTICAGQTASFNGFSGCATCQYLWDDSVSAVFYSTGIAGWHYLDITNNNTGCIGHDSVWLEVESTDPPQMAPDYELGICAGDSVYISVVDEYTSYLWNTGEATQGIFVFDSGTYVVTVTTPSGCEATSDTIYVLVQPLPQPEITWQFTSTWNIRLDATPGFQAYNWNTGSNTSSTVALTTGMYYVTVEDEFGCEGVDSLFVLVTGNQELKVEGLAIYPNPSDGAFTIEVAETWGQNTHMEIKDLSGRLVAQETLRPGQNKCNLSFLSAGQYMVFLSGQKRSVTSKIIIY